MHVNSGTVRGADSAHIMHTPLTKDALCTDRSSNCIQWIIKLHELRHSCPDDSGRKEEEVGGGWHEGMRLDLGLNARRVPMQFHLIKKSECAACIAMRHLSAGLRRLSAA